MLTSIFYILNIFSMLTSIFNILYTFLLLTSIFYIYFCCSPPYLPPPPPNRPPPPPCPTSSASFGFTTWKISNILTILSKLDVVKYVLEFLITWKSNTLYHSKCKKTALGYILSTCLASVRTSTRSRAWK